MNLIGIIETNKDILKLVYTLILFFICFSIVIKTNKLFKLSSHQGIRYFRNAFLFYGLAFIFKYLTGIPTDYSYEWISGFFSPAKIFYEFLLVMAAFFLLYSMLWKHFEETTGSFSSLFNPRIIIFYALALIISILDSIWGTYYFVFLLQTITFSFAAGHAFARYYDGSKNSGFFGLYLLVIVLNLVIWTAQSVILSSFKFDIDSVIDWHLYSVITLYLLNGIIFSIIWYGVDRTTKR